VFNENLEVVGGENSAVLFVHIESVVGVLVVNNNMARISRFQTDKLILFSVGNTSGRKQPSVLLHAQRLHTSQKRGQLLFINHFFQLQITVDEVGSARHLSSAVVFLRIQGAWDGIVVGVDVNGRATTQVNESNPPVRQIVVGHPALDVKILLKTRPMSAQKFISIFCESHKFFLIQKRLHTTKETVACALEARNSKTWESMLEGESQELSAFNVQVFQGGSPDFCDHRRLARRIEYPSLVVQ
jgi:hypothetical protein